MTKLINFQDISKFCNITLEKLEECVEVGWDGTPFEIFINRKSFTIICIIALVRKIYNSYNYLFGN